MKRTLSISNFTEIYKYINPKHKDRFLYDLDIFLLNQWKSYEESKDVQSNFLWDIHVLSEDDRVLSMDFGINCNKVSRNFFILLTIAAYLSHNKKESFGQSLKDIGILQYCEDNQITSINQGEDSKHFLKFYNQNLKRFIFPLNYKHVAILKFIIDTIDNLAFGDYLFSVNLFVSEGNLYITEGLSKMSDDDIIKSLGIYTNNNIYSKLVDYHTEFTNFDITCEDNLIHRKDRFVYCVTSKDIIDSIKEFKTDIVKFSDRYFKYGSYYDYANNNLKFNGNIDEISINLKNLKLLNLGVVNRELNDIVVNKVLHEYFKDEDIKKIDIFIHKGIIDHDIDGAISYLDNGEIEEVFIFTSTIKKLNLL